MKGNALLDDLFYVISAGNGVPSAENMGEFFIWKDWRSDIMQVCPCREHMNQPDHTATPYYRLDPDTVIGAIESTGLMCDGRLLALNSYENRVYQVGLEEAADWPRQF